MSEKKDNCLKCSENIAWDEDLWYNLNKDRERKLLKKVQEALQRLEKGEYGWCEETGDPIGIPRLLARPTATLSLEAQQRRELRQKLYGN